MAKIAIAFSGGWDAMITYLWLKHNGYKDEDLFLYTVRYGQPYEKEEVKAIEILSEKYNLNVKQYNVNLLDDTNSPDIVNPVIPARNLLIAYLGAFNCDTVAFSAPFGEHRFIEQKWNTLDENPTAYEKMGEALTYLMGKKITVVNFLNHKTKSEWLSWLMDNFMPSEWEFILRNTVSCYQDNYCGKCLACFLKWCMLKNNNLPIDDYFVNGFDLKSIPIQKTINGFKKYNEQINHSDLHYNDFLVRYMEIRSALNDDN
jgi:7-cyano-7-deazaguanine synthase in queuosine biosynthesis